MVSIITSTIIFTLLQRVLDNNDVFNYIQDNAKLYGGEIGFHFHPHPLDWLHYETSFETVTGKKQDGDYCH
jgi:iron complex outermembrane receptor protein